VLLVGARGGGVDDLPVGESVPVPPEVDSRPAGAFVVQEPVMSPSPASSSSRRLAAGSMPAPATTTMPSRPCPAWNWRMTGSSVSVSALDPSKQPVSSRKPCRPASSPANDLRADPPLLGVPGPCAGRPPSPPRNTTSMPTFSLCRCRACCRRSGRRGCSGSRHILMGRSFKYSSTWRSSCATCSPWCAEGSACGRGGG
jgi:hypothetical protein